MADKFYSFTRSLNPATRDTRFGTSTWIVGSPISEKVVRCLLTTQGSYLPDKDYGVRWHLLTHDRTNSEVVIRSELERALDRFVRSGEMKDLQITIAKAKGRILADIAFTDPRTAKQETVTLSL